MLRKSDSGINRRTFCNRALLSSAAVIVAGSKVAGQKDQQQNLLAYPPTKIEGAERVMPGSFLYFDYPKQIIRPYCCERWTGNTSLTVVVRAPQVFGRLRRCSSMS